MLALLLGKQCIYFPSWILVHVDSKTTLGSSQNCIYLAGKLWDISTRFLTEGEPVSTDWRLYSLIEFLYFLFLSFLWIGSHVAQGFSPFSVAPGDLELLLIYFWTINFWASASDLLSAGSACLCCHIPAIRLGACFALGNYQLNHSLREPVLPLFSKGIVST